jgi:hypothetical protein
MAHPQRTRDPLASQRQSQLRGAFPSDSTVRDNKGLAMLSLKITTIGGYGGHGDAPVFTQCATVRPILERGARFADLMENDAHSPLGRPFGSETFIRNAEASPPNPRPQQARAQTEGEARSVSGNGDSHTRHRNAKADIRSSPVIWGGWSLA